jgi:hypothetical protein
MALVSIRRHFNLTLQVDYALLAKFPGSRLVASDCREPLQFKPLIGGSA